MVGRPWHPEEIEAIRHLPAGGLDALASLFVNRRSRSAIARKRDLMGFTVRLPNWQPDDDAAIEAAVAAGRTVEDAAAAIGRTAVAAYRRRSRRRARGEDVPRPMGCATDDRGTRR